MQVEFVREPPDTSSWSEVQTSLCLGMHAGDQFCTRIKRQSQTTLAFGTRQGWRSELTASLCPASTLALKLLL